MRLKKEKFFPVKKEETEKMEVKNAVLLTDIKAQYDAYAKKLLGHKIILAHILVRSVEEFRGMSPEEVVPLIEGEPYINTVPIEPGFTNKKLNLENDQEIIGMNTENTEINAGYIRFDIIFYVRMKDGISQIIINIEAQKKEPTDYDILNRAIFYVSRMISSQKNRDFQGSNYNDIKKVYSIWICMNMEEDSMAHIHLVNENLMGNHEWKGNLELVNIIMIGLAKEISEKEEQHELHRFLGTLFSKKIEADKKLDILENEYHILRGKALEEDVKTMCNLSEGIEEEAMEAGRKEGKKELLKQLVKKKLMKGKNINIIADELEEDVSIIQPIIDEIKKENKGQ